MVSFQDVSINEMQQVEGGWDWGAFFTGVEIGLAIAAL